MVQNGCSIRGADRSGHGGQNGDVLGTDEQENCDEVERASSSRQLEKSFRVAKSLHRATPARTGVAGELPAVMPDVC